MSISSTGDFNNDSLEDGSLLSWSIVCVDGNPRVVNWIVDSVALIIIYLEDICVVGCRKMRS
jgi:hypothetical protein